MVRVKRRYILLQAIRGPGSKVKLSDAAVKREIKDQIVEDYGDFGLGCLDRGFSIKKLDKADGYVIIQLRHGVHEMVMSVIPLITKLDGEVYDFTILNLSGTLRGSLKSLRQHYIVSIRKMIGELETKHKHQRHPQANLQEELANQDIDET